MTAEGARVAYTNVLITQPGTTHFLYKKSTFVIVTQIYLYSNTICKRMLGVSPFYLGRINSVVMEKEQKYAW